MTRIFAFLWAVWGLITFMVVVITLTPIYAILLGIFGRRFAMKLVWVNYHYASPLLLFLSGIRLRIYGKEFINKHQTYVFVSNHISWIDVMCNASATPKPAKFIAKSELKKFPVFGFMVRMLAIMVDRQDKDSREKSMLYMAEELKRGNSIFLYPEGTRNRTPELLKDFKDGAFRAAIAAQVPISWQVLVGVKEINRNGIPFLLPGTVKVIFGKPVPTTGLTQDDVPMLHQKIKQLMWNELLKHYTPEFFRSLSVS